MAESGSASGRWHVSGRVQGVGFRWWVQREADALGLAGWVRNLPDGRVEVCATGPASALATLALALEKGPRFAAVVRVEKLVAPPEIDQLKSFVIK